MVTAQVAASYGVGDVTTALHRERWHTTLGTVSLTSRSRSVQCDDGSPWQSETRACDRLVPERLGFECQPGSVSGGCVSGVGHGVGFHHPQPNTSLDRMHELAVYEPPFSLGR